MQSVATRTRVNQITILVAISFLFYQFASWDHGVWIIISTVVVAGPFSTFLSHQKAKDRFLGTLVGLVVAAGIEYYLLFNPSQLPVVAVLLAFVAGFMVTQPYKYFIVIITTCTCLAYTYMNIPYTTFSPMSFLVDRGMGVFVGVLIFLVMQRFVFGTGNSRLELIEESHDVLQKLQSTLREYQQTPTVTTAYKCAADIFQHTKDLKDYVGSATLVFGTETPKEVRFAKTVLLLNRRALKVLIDEPMTVPGQINRLLHIAELKLERSG